MKATTRRFTPRKRNRGQFSIIAALLVSVILIATVIMTYSVIRYGTRLDSPEVLVSIGEVNGAIQQVLDFTVGYYGSILEVTANTTYAKAQAASYLQSGLVEIAHSHPDWNPAFNLQVQEVATCWFTPASSSVGNISVTYSMSGLGIQGVKYETSAYLGVTMLEPTSEGEARVQVVKEGDEVVLELKRSNFFFYNYSYSESKWKKISPVGDPISYSNGTYVLAIPPGVNPNAFSLQVVDSRGIMASTFYTPESLTSGVPQYQYTFDWNAGGKGEVYSRLSNDTLVVEALQNGTLRWLGQTLQLSTLGYPIPPIPVRSIHVNCTVSGVTREMPFQVESWSSNYQLPLGFSSNVSIFDRRNMLVFLADHTVEEVTLWWNGWDTTTQTTYAWRNRYFTDDPDAGVLSNGDLTLNLGDFDITSTVGSASAVAEFMRINGEEPVYGAAPSVVIYNGVVRDIVQQEAEWSGGASGCPDLYSQMVFTLPANVTYYTYALRTIFVNTSQSRSLNEVSVLELTIDPGTPGTGECITEDGLDGSGFPVPSFLERQFYNTGSTTGWAHHWSEFVKGNRGAGVMFTTDSNLKLYAFDEIAGDKTGALDVYKIFSDTLGHIEVNPVERFSAAFTEPLDLTWYGVVVTFDATSPYDTIYPSSGESEGLWVLVEQPPTIAVS